MNESWWVHPYQLDDDQKKAVALPIDKSYLITGPPGSGKTNLLLLRATHLCRSGKPNVLILVFTRTLREFLCSGEHNYAFGADKIKTIASWAASFLKEYGIEPKTADSFDKQRRLQVAQLRELVQREKLKCEYDAIILDEAQDCLPEEIEIFDKLAGVLFVATDSKQKIYSTKDPLAKIRELVPNKFELRYHYRNGLKICRLADALAKHSELNRNLEETSNYNERKLPSSVEVEQCASVSDQVDKAIVKLTTQLKAYPEELLGIVCPTHEELDKVIKCLRASRLNRVCVYQGAEDGYVPFSKDTMICVCTIHSAKGLEFRALHVLGLDSIGKFYSYSRNTAFTAVTRAKTSLTLYHTMGLRPFLESAIVSLQKQPAPPELSELFKGSSDDKPKD